MKIYLNEWIDAEEGYMSELLIYVEIVELWLNAPFRDNNEIEACFFTDKWYTEIENGESSLTLIGEV